MCELLHINKHMAFHIASVALAVALALGNARAEAPLVEYKMHMAPSPDAKRVALTFDACTKRVDDRILNALVDNQIKATIFVSGRWLKHNPAAIATLKAHPDLFEIENHGARHLAAVDDGRLVYGEKSAGSAEAIKQEILDGAAAVHKEFDVGPLWYRGTGAEYTVTSMYLIEEMGVKLAGFTFTGDAGATYSAAMAAKVVGAAKDGDVILAHMNHPEKPAGAGVVEGILRLKAEGFDFVKLDQGF